MLVRLIEHVDLKLQKRRICKNWSFDETLRESFESFFLAKCKSVTSILLYSINVNITADLVWEERFSCDRFSLLLLLFSLRMHFKVNANGVSMSCTKFSFPLMSTWNQQKLLLFHYSSIKMNRICRRANYYLCRIERSLCFSHSIVPFACNPLLLPF